MQAKGILFVCLGNICRSPMAEAVMKHLAAHAGRKEEFVIDSAGIGDWHIGNKADSRTLKTLQVHGLEEPSRCRQLESSDFEEFDYIIGMDQQNIKDLQKWPGAQPGKISMAMEWVEGPNASIVPDPYYGSQNDFEAVYQQLTRACQAILEKA
jgi:protein-tyrosine phosphatase